MIEEKLIDSLKPHPINERVYGDTYDHKLITSIKKYGLHGTIEITKENVIISGHRRWHVCQELGYETVPVTVLDEKDEDKLVEYLITMNQATRERTNEQIAREFEVLLEIEDKKAKERLVKSGKDYGKGAKGVENFPHPIEDKSEDDPVPDLFPEVESAKDEPEDKSVPDMFSEVEPIKGKSRDKAAKKLNNKWSGRTAQKAHETVQYADSIENEEPEAAKQIKDTLNKKSVNAAHKETKKHQAKTAKKMNAVNDNIEWSKWSWNPITGCLHDCPYCYAKDIAMRYGKHFKPTFHKDRLSAPANTNIPKRRINETGINNVFVCSMADLFGKWVDAEWIDQVIEVCTIQDQWNYLFLTKNPKRYLEFEFPKNCWLGASATNQKQFNRAIDVFTEIGSNIKFLSCEPLNEQIIVEELELAIIDWLIIGGRSKSTEMKAFQPEWEWVEHLFESARVASVPVYFKPNLTVRPKEYPI